MIELSLQTIGTLLKAIGRIHPFKQRYLSFLLKQYEDDWLTGKSNGRQEKEARGAGIRRLRGFTF